MFEVIERGEMTRVEEVFGLLVLMLEDIFVLEVAMRQLAWNCNEKNCVQFVLRITFGYRQIIPRGVLYRSGLPVG